jgi:hypothetical protein
MEEDLATHFFSQKMKRDVQRFMTRCLTCKKVKSRLNPHGLYTPLLVSSVPRANISIDFSFGLPRTKRRRNTIFRFSKIAYFIPYHKSDDDVYIAYLFFKEIVRSHGMPCTIISDGDVKFLNHF